MEGAVALIGPMGQIEDGRPRVLGIWLSVTSARCWRLHFLAHGWVIANPRR